MARAISGKILKITFGDLSIRCQTDGTLTINKEVSTDEPCKDDGGWNTGSITSKSWTISMTAKAFLDSIASNQLDLIDVMLASDEPGEIEFMSDPAMSGDRTLNVVLSGSAFLNQLVWNAPANATSTYTADFTGDGPLTKVETPVTP